MSWHPDPLVAECPYCHETIEEDDIEASTWQQWQCPCCGSWNDKPDEDHPNQNREGDGHAAPLSLT